MTTVTVDIQCDKERICVNFRRDVLVTKAVREIDGRSFVKTPHQHWHVPLDLNTCRQLRKHFGEDLEIGERLNSWAVQAVREEQTLGTLALADTAELQRLPSVLPLLAMCIHVGPIGLTFTDESQWVKALDEPGSFQVADVRFLVEATAPLNANQQGLGKTPEWIAAVWEGGWEAGNHLVVCTSSAVDGTWEPELEQWQGDAPCDVGIFCCTGTKAQRKATLKEWKASTAPVKWVVVNPEMIRWRKDPNGKIIVPVPPMTKAALNACRCDVRKQPHTHYTTAYPELDINWTTYNVDECHKNSIRNEKTVTAKSLRSIRHEVKRCAMSGTPCKKKGADIWGHLNWLRPEAFPSKWRFATAFFDIEENYFGKKILDLLPEKQDAFFDAIKPYVLRRTKAECLPWLPPKQIVPVWCNMEPAQAKAYEQMLKQGAAKLGRTTVYSTSILAEFTRLGQFASALCAVKAGVIVPTKTSCKIVAMLDKMEEACMFDEDCVDKQVIFSSSKKLIYLVADVLRNKMEAEDAVVVLSGDQNKKGQRRQIKEAFQKGDTRILCVVTQAGGTSLTLDAADVAHFLDESWAYDDTEQAEDRLHRASRVHNVTVYMYRTKGTIDEYRMDVALSKKQAQAMVMDVRRKLLKEAA